MQPKHNHKKGKKYKEKKKKSWGLSGPHLRVEPGPHGPLPGTDDMYAKSGCGISLPTMVGWLAVSSSVYFPIALVTGRQAGRQAYRDDGWSKQAESGRMIIRQRNRAV